MISLNNSFKLWHIGFKSPSLGSCMQSINAQQIAGIKTLEEKVGLPPKPKKPLTPYFRYMQDFRQGIQKENPKLGIMEITKLLSKKWETVDSKEKQRYMDEYRKDQIRFVETRAKYDSKITDAQRSEMKQIKQDVLEAKERKAIKKRIRELGKPKRPASAFLRFVIKERVNTPQNASQTYKQWHQKATEKWSRMSDSEKEFYLQEARKEYVTYKVLINEWEEKMVRLGHVDVVRNDSLIDPPEPKTRKSRKVE